MKPISVTAKSIAPSATLAIDTLAKQMKADGIDVIAFGAGEPDFNTPEHIKQAGIEAIRTNKTRYTPASGLPALKAAICANIKQQYGLDYENKNICVSSGAKHIVYMSVMALCNPGDEVILPAPYWVTYVEIIRMAGAVPVIIDTDERTHFKITAEMLEAAVTEKTKCLLLNNPSNPTGMVYTRQELESLMTVVQKHDLYVISDEIYNTLTYGCTHTCLPTLGEDIKNRTILIDGLSKTYAMTGWRVGYSAANEEITKAMSNYLSHSTGSTCTISQYAGMEALANVTDEAEQMRQAFDARRKYFLSRVAKIDGVSCIEPEGAFYIFMNIKPQLGKTFFGEKVETSAQFAQCLLKNGLVAVVPGDAFGAEGYIRWSYATSMEMIREGLDRFERFLKQGK